MAGDDVRAQSPDAAAREGLLCAVDERVRRFAESGEPSLVLDEAAASLVQRLEELINGATEFDLEVYLALASLHWCRYQVLPEGADDEAFGAAYTYFVAIARIVPLGGPEPTRRYLAGDGPALEFVAGWVSEQARGAFLAFQRSRDVGHLDTAVLLLGQAVNITPAGEFRRAVRLSDLGLMLATRFELTGQAGNLDSAIRMGRAAVDAAWADDPQRALYRSNLGASLRARFELTGQVADLDAAIAAGQQALNAAPDGQVDGDWLSNLAGALQRRFELTGTAGDLDAAIDMVGQAVGVTAPGDPNRPGMLSNLGLALLRRFELAGQVADLDAGISAARGAATAAPGTPGFLSNLGLALLRRFESTGQLGDLNAAVTANRQAVDATPDGHHDRAMYLSNFGASLRTRFERTGLTADLDAAVTAGEQAVAIVPDSHPDRPWILSNLGGILQRRFESARQGDDLDRAVTIGQAAVDAAPPGHTNRATYLANLGNALTARFEWTGQVQDLDAAIAVGQAAVATISVDHPQRALMLSNLGNSRYARFRRTRQRADLDAAIGCWRMAVAVDTASAAVRLGAARAWGRRAFEAGDVASAADGYAAGVLLLPQAAWHGLDRATQEYQLADWADLVTDAAAGAASAGQPHRAVELLEQGRSVLWNQVLNLRSDLTGLRARAPELAGALDTVRRQLDQPMPADGPGGPALADQERELESRRRLARQWDDLLGQVRRLDGFENFLEPVPFAQLQPAAADGPVVIVNASRLGCQALILTADGDGVRLVALPDLNHQEAVDQANRLHRALSEGLFPDGVVFDVLDWLWRVIAEPVLDALGPQPGLPGALPRVWWCPVGPLALLPLHAAGQYTRALTPPTPPEKTVPGRVVSSYAPSVAALKRARQAPVPAAASRQLAVGLPDTPGHAPLPAVPGELAALAAYFPPPGRGRHVVAAEATRAAVLESLADYPWLHLACHAYQDPDDSARSAFALWDGPLTLAELAALPAVRGQLAFLSACETAAGDTRLPDEAIHLAAAMQLLGYRHVIATLWTIADSSAPQVAAAVYARLAGAGEADAAGAARALHRATEALRLAHPDSPLLWAPYVHIGA
jgi:tetratricopeptide (TPR) repeat protein